MNGESRAHWKVALDAFVVNVNDALVEFVGFADLVPIVGVAGVATVHV